MRKTDISITQLINQIPNDDITDSVTTHQNSSTFASPALVTCDTAQTTRFERLLRRELKQYPDIHYIQTDFAEYLVYMRHGQAKLAGDVFDILSYTDTTLRGVRVRVESTSQSQNAIGEIVTLDRTDDLTTTLPDGTAPLPDRDTLCLSHLSPGAFVVRVGQVIATKENTSDNQTKFEHDDHQFRLIIVSPSLKSNEHITLTASEILTAKEIFYTIQRSSATHERHQIPSHYDDVYDTICYLSVLIRHKRNPTNPTWSSRLQEYKNDDLYQTTQPDWLVDTPTEE